MATNHRVGQLAQGWSAGQVLSHLQYSKGSNDLNGAYVRNSSGPAYAVPFKPETSGNLTEIHVAVRDLQGTWGNTDGNIQYEVYSAGLAGTRRIDASSAPAYSGNIALTTGDTDRWRGTTGLSHALTAQTKYWISISDSDGGGTDYARMWSNCRIRGRPVQNFGESIDTTDGWATNGATNSYPPQVLIKYDGEWWCGSITVTQANSTNNTLYKGLRLYIPDTVMLIGVGGPSVYDTAEDCRFAVFADGDGPGDTPLKTYDFDGSGTTQPVENENIMDPADWYELTGGTWYRFAWKSIGASSRQPTYLGPGTGFPTGAWDAICSLDGTNGVKRIEDNGAGGWTDTDEEMFSAGPVLLPSTQAGGGGAPGNMQGGLQ